ncbi:MAG TPA: hypothetical protein PL168_10000, partial [Methanobacterium sp.]|nr:hypothetical protein [Methanobacterium sp.]
MDILPPLNQYVVCHFIYRNSLLYTIYDSIIINGVDFLTTLEKRNLKKEMYTFLVVTFAATYIL